MWDAEAVNTRQCGSAVNERKYKMHKRHSAIVFVPGSASEMEETKGGDSHSAYAHSFRNIIVTASTFHFRMDEKK